MGIDNFAEQASSQLTHRTQEANTLAGGAPEPPGGSVPTDGGEDFHNLDRRVIRLWATTGGIKRSVLLLAGIVGGVLLRSYHEASFLLIIPGWLALALLVLLETLWLPVKRYQTTTYRLGNGFFEFRSGIFWKSSVMIPLSRIQHVDLLRGPLEQRYGLATLVLHTAGTTQASQAVPGLEVGDAVRLREMIGAAADIDWDQNPGTDSETLER